VTRADHRLVPNKLTEPERVVFGILHPRQNPRFLNTSNYIIYSAFEMVMLPDGLFN
jgi:hypothetical protein